MPRAHRRVSPVLRFILRRLAQALFVLAAAFTAAFLLLQAMPGDAILIKFQSPELGLSPEQIADIRASYGADTPLAAQFLHTALGFLGGDFGYSLQYGTPVAELIAAAIPGTALLGLLGLVTAVLLALGLAAGARLPRGAWVRGFVRSLPPLFISLPVFWIGIVLIQVFSFQLGLVPVINPGPVQGLILPVLTLAIPIAAPLAQILIRSLDEVTARPFVAVARARGASEPRILVRQVTRNALPPALTMMGVLLGELIGGAVVTETVFGRAGLGRLTEQAVSQQDTPVIQAVVLLSALVFVVVNLAIDLLYPILDPRLSPTRGVHA